MKAKSLISVVFLTLLILTSCEKNEIKDKPERSFEMIVLSEGQVLYKNPNNIIDYLTNDNDPCDEKIRRQRYEIGLLVRDLFVDNTYNKLLIDNALTKANTAVCLQMFVNEFKAIKSGDDNNQKVFLNLQTALKSVDFTRRSTNPYEKGKIEEYIPTL